MRRQEQLPKRAAAGVQAWIWSTSGLLGPGGLAPRGLPRPLTARWKVAGLRCSLTRCRAGASVSVRRLTGLAMLRVREIEPTASVPLGSLVAMGGNSPGVFEDSRDVEQ